MKKKTVVAGIGATLIAGALAAGTVLAGTASAAPDQVNVVTRPLTGVDAASLNAQWDDLQDRLRGRDEVTRVTRDCGDVTFSTAEVSRTRTGPTMKLVPGKTHFAPSNVPNYDQPVLVTDPPTWVPIPLSEQQVLVQTVTTATQECTYYVHRKG